MSDFTILSKNKKVDECYGLEAFYITKEEIDALLSGKKLYSIVNDGEYAITIQMRKSKTAKIKGIDLNSLTPDSGID